MLNTHIYLSEYATPTQFKLISGSGLFACVWELEVINHERLAWVQHVLHQYPTPDYATYLQASFSKWL